MVEPAEQTPRQRLEHDIELIVKQHLVELVTDGPAAGSMTRMVSALADDIEHRLNERDLENLPKPFYTVEEAARILGCSDRTIYRSIADGDIPTTITLLGKRRIPAAEFDQLINRRDDDPDVD